jgi:hypothetical protein
MRVQELGKTRGRQQKSRKESILKLEKSITRRLMHGWNCLGTISPKARVRTNIKRRKGTICTLLSALPKNTLCPHKVLDFIGD